jgi:DNA-binding transcriptional LysR family regulator
MKALVANGDGVAILTRESVASEVQEGRIAVFALDNENLKLPLFVTYRAKHQLGRAAAATLEVIRRLLGS